MKALCSLLATSVCLLATAALGAPVIEFSVTPERDLLVGGETKHAI